MDEHRLRALLERYTAGDTSLAEEVEIGERLAAAHDLPRDMAWADAMFGHFAAAARETCAAPAPKTRRIRGTVAFRAAAVAATVAAVVAVGVVTHRAADTPSPLVYCYVNGEPVTDRALAAHYAGDALGLAAQSMREPAAYLAPIETLNRSLESLRVLTELGGILAKENE